jgi:diguanylate cyclase (GGDEF)-like protein
VSLEKGVTGRCVRTGLVQRIPDVTKDPEFVEVTPGIRSELCVPIQSERRIYGVINAESRIPDAFSEDDERFLTTVSAQIATALERIHLFEAAQQRAEEQYLLFSAAREFSSALDQEAVLYTIARHMVKLLHAPDCAILRWERSADQLVTLLDYDTALPNRGDAPGTVYSLADYPASREVLLSRKPLIVRLDDLEADPAERAILERYNYAAMLMLPLIAGSEAFGLIELYRESGAPAFMPSEVQLAQSLAAQAAIALENARLHHQVKKLAITDDLTGLFNRRHLFELGAREVQRARRFGRPLSAIMLDIDDFKAVNDTHGHAVGDEVLREVARRCAASLREIDIFGRYGGDEFAGFLPESSLSVAEQVAERLRASVSKEPFCPQEGLQLHLTISVGVASLESGLYDAATLLSHADLALYAAKQKGRNGMATFPITP